MPWHPALTDRDAVVAAVEESVSVRSALHRLGLPYNQRSRDMLSAACHNYGISPNFRARRPRQRMTDEEIFIENSPYVCNRPTLKRRFIEATGTPEKCALCGQGPTWNGLTLTLQLDHKNGVNDDHRFDNLRLLCPNCHTQTPTYAGKRPSASVSVICMYEPCSRPFIPVRRRPLQQPLFCSISCANRHRYARRSTGEAV